jgi:hypothetical protein
VVATCPAASSANEGGTSARGRRWRAGFESIQEFALGESDDPELVGVEGRQHSSAARLNAYETMVWQAVKPHARD